MSRPILDSYLGRNDFESKVINFILDQCSLNFSNLEASNHLAILDFLDRQKELHKVQREILMRYLSLAVSDLKYEPS
jgi:hypothetical protein